MRALGRVTLLTDFGTRDGYVGAMKGVMASIAPELLFDDVSHQVSRGGVKEAALTLARYWNRYPRRTVHLVVVDPGVGTERRALCLEAEGRYVVAPDNGVVSEVLGAAQRWKAVALSDPRYLLPNRSRTFHGRDVFAPAAAHLARGVLPSELGPEISDPIRLGLPSPHSVEGGMEGEVVYVDLFGNLATNLPGEGMDPWREGRATGEVELAGVRVPFVGTYGDAGPGELLALVNSDGRVEVAVRDGSALDRLGTGVGSRVLLRGHPRASDDPPP